MGWYACFVVRYPWLWLIVDVSVMLLCAPIVYWVHGVPDLSDTGKGFETRGTAIFGWKEAEIKLSEFPNMTVWPSVNDFKLNDLDIGYASCADTRINGSLTRMSVESRGEHINLLTADYLHSICDLEQQYITQYLPTQACRAHSLPLYIGALRNKTCWELEGNDVDIVLDLLTRCSKHYFNGNLTAMCGTEDTCLSVPEECYEHNAVFKILHYLTDGHFMPDGDTTQLTVRLTMILFPREWNLTDELLRNYFFDHLDGNTLNNELIKISGIQLEADVASMVFDQYVFMDLPFYGLAMVLVIIVLLLYLRSLVLTLSVALNMAFSLVVSYFMYMMVLQFNFFPFVNLLAFLLLIAVGADDVFILYDIWMKKKDEHPCYNVEELMSRVLHHGASSIFVTSLTTAAALFSNYVSAIPAIGSFGVFSGICILVNFIFMITWVPSVIVLMNRYEDRYCCCSGVKCDSHCGQKLMSKLATVSSIFWGQWMPTIITKLSPLWLVLFGALGIGGFIVIFVTPKFTLPTSNKSRVLYTSHPIEVYKWKKMDHFRFEVDVGEDTVGVRWVFGVEGKDHGDPMDPDDTGNLVFDDDFKIYTPEAQQWMLDFCERLRTQDFVRNPNAYECSMLRIKSLFEGPCSVKFMNSTVDLGDCCRSTFPLATLRAARCFTDRSFLHVVSGISNVTLLGELFQDDATLDIRAVRYDVETNQEFTTEYEAMGNFYDTLDSFTKAELKHAPRECSTGGFSSTDFWYYDVQHALATGTYISISLSLSVGGLVLLVTSLNLLITLYSIVTITLVIAVTIGALVLQGWELNIGEAITITLSVGLSIDFAIHYGIAFKISGNITRKERIYDVVSAVGSAVTMAALTTFLAGASLMQGRVLSYRRFGIFLMLVMVISWVFSTFFFNAICQYIGPLGRLTDLSVLCDPCRKRNKHTQHALSTESTTIGSKKGRAEQCEQNGCSVQHDLQSQ